MIISPTMGLIPMEINKLDRKREYARKYYHKHRDKYRKSQNEKRRRKRLAVIDYLGGKCVYCGCDNIDAMEINHKNGGGSKEHRKRTRRHKLYNEILQGKRDDIELTCAICNEWHRLVVLGGIAGNWSIKWTA